ncbi:hypothetical protein ABZP36_029946 [Zizania latifolia]
MASPPSSNPAPEPLPLLLPPPPELVPLLTPLEARPKPSPTIANNIRGLLRAAGLPAIVVIQQLRRARRAVRQPDATENHHSSATAGAIATGVKRDGAGPDAGMLPPPQSHLYGPCSSCRLCPTGSRHGEHELGWGLRMGCTVEGEVHWPHVEGFLSFNLSKGCRVQPGLVIDVGDKKWTPVLVLWSFWLM